MSYRDAVMTQNSWKTGLNENGFRNVITFKIKFAVYFICFTNHPPVFLSCFSLSEVLMFVVLNKWKILESWVLSLSLQRPNPSFEMARGPDYRRWAPRADTAGPKGKSKTSFSCSDVYHMSLCMCHVESNLCGIIIYFIPVRQLKVGDEYL